jgi:DNA-binding beta-propeller fold protein YncE
VFGQEGGHLKKPINIAIDELGFKFLADAVKNEVVVFGPDDAFVTSHRVPPPCRVVDVGLWGNELYVLDNDSTPQIVVLDRTNGTVLRTFGGRGNDPGLFNAPAGLAVGPDGSVYVSDAVSCRIQKLDRSGKPIWSKGGQGYHVGQFGRPRGIRTAPDGVLYVADAATEIVQLWNDQGQPLMHIGGPGNMPGAMVLPSNVAVDSSSLPYFRDLVHPDFQADYLVFVASQYGRRLVNVYAFGSFPEGYKLPESQWRTIPVIPPPAEAQGPARQHPAGEAQPESPAAPSAPDASPPARESR